MSRISLIIQKGIDVSEFKKIIGFISEDITSYSVTGNTLDIEVGDAGNCDAITEEVNKLMKQYVSTASKETTIYEKVMPEKEYVYEASKDIHRFYDGSIGFENKALFLYRYFERTFNEVAHSIEPNNCIEKLYPVLLHLEHYQKTGYLSNSPQYAIFCCSACENMSKLEDLNKQVRNKKLDTFLSYPSFALSPSACFHTSCEYENRILNDRQTITFTQSVFRNEGRFNFTDFGRLLDYHVKEIVFFGDMEYVSEMINKAINKAIELVRSWGLEGKVTTASDPFIIPKMQKFKKIQLMEVSKYELRLNYSRDQMLSVASFNLHGTAFTQPFNIKIKDCDITVTGCVGFGLERWVLAFLRQYGDNIDKWPKDIREEFYNG